jgi:hypothetical protein
VVGALKKAINPLSGSMGIHVCGGRGKFSRQTPEELLRLAEATGLDGQALVRSSRLSAKVDSTAVQDGFQLYLHSFIVSDRGEWVVVQQGMNTGIRVARRYHWHSARLASFVTEPHSAVYGPNQGPILNLTHREAGPTQAGILAVTRDGRPEEWRRLVMPAHHDVRSSDIDIKRLGAVLALAHEKQPMDFESLLLLEGVGPRTLQSLTLVSEVIHGTPSRFSDPARFSFAHGGKDGHPFPVPLAVYDQTIQVLEKAVSRAKLGKEDSGQALRKLSQLSAELEKGFVPEDRVDEWIRHERATSYQYGGRTVSGEARPPEGSARRTRAVAEAAAQRPQAGAPAQLTLF